MVVPFTKNIQQVLEFTLKVGLQQKVLHWIIFAFAIHTLIIRFDPAQGC